MQNLLIARERLSENNKAEFPPPPPLQKLVDEVFCVGIYHRTGLLILCAYYASLLILSAL